MKPGRLEVLLYIVGVLLLLGGAVVRVGHLASARLGFTLLAAGFLVGSVGRLVGWRRARRLRQQELKA
ncbi:hypothetical protein [Hymenobacter psychrotolerans]|uniref:Uncharacterized protein n=1 Tax=Hymenobacter psychrotolerans DSM 18569 TaxID=1121959 RepID=A0A1M6YPR8_9BACT|nr:hypothetical protein [Hymenobacter psychrotolerans]SHL20207.1 hypothetical protein SAMN02746009_02334 [Hymenobacter psychrotolerans DSM 18569]